MSNGIGGDGRLDTIRGLLAKAEATPFPAEAEAFLEKATELMSRYAIDEAMLWAEERGARTTPVERRLVLRAPYLNQKAVLVNVVAGSFGVRAVRLGSMGGSATEAVAIVGFEGDLDLVETLVTSLMIQIDAGILTEQPETGVASLSAAWRRSYIMGFVDVVSDRLATQRRQAAAAAASESGGEASSVAVVLVDRSATVDSEFRRRYPSLRNSRVSAGTSAAGRVAGRAAGERADLGGRRVGARAALR